jgi:hypothetical protein
MYDIEYMVVIAIFIVIMGFIYNTFFNGGDWDE